MTKQNANDLDRSKSLNPHNANDSQKAEPGDKDVHVNGQCLCGKTQFVITEMPNLYQCHCQLCQKQGGSISNTATIISRHKFEWIERGKVGSYKKDTGFTSEFCMHCGCPVPNQLRNTDYVWVPAGALDFNDINNHSSNNFHASEYERPKIVAHIYMDSKAPWDSHHYQGEKYSEMPSLERLVTILHADDH